MSNVLLLTSSPRGAASHSSAVARDLAGRLAAGTPGATITTRDLAADPVPHIDGVFLAAVFSAHPESLLDGQREALERSDAAIAQVLAADTIVIAAPMINFSVPTTLRAWFDNILRVGKTFRYTEAGAEGLVKGKKVYLVTASGGVYSDGAMKVMDFQVPYLKALLGFIGLTDVEVISVEGVAFGPEHAEKAVAAAHAQVAGTAPGEARAA